LHARRIRLLAVVSILALAAVGTRAAYLGTVRADDLSARATDSNRDQISLIAQRGSIISGDGRVLATDNLKVDITASPDIIEDPAGTAQQLARVLGRDAGDIAPLLVGDEQYAVVARGVPVARADKARRLGLTGIHFEDTYDRFLPGGALAAQVIGLTGTDGEGLSGLEADLDAPLTGTPGTRVRVKDAFGRTLRVAADRDPVPGADVTLTIDSAIQDRTERILQDTRATHGASSAMAVVMDPRDGRILSMATVPGYDPNRRRQLNQELTRNRPATDMFEPGSTFKIVTMTGALEDGVVEPSTVFDLPAVYQLYDREIKESHRDYDTTLTAAQILEQSSNVGTVKIAQALGKDRQIAWMERFGFGRETGLDFPGESAGYLRPSEEWFGFSIGNIPIGQGVSVTLTQLARAYAAIANGGTLVTPHLVQSVGDTPAAVPPARRIVSQGTAAEVDAMLRKVVSADGTGIAAAVRGYEVAGKTGTAQKYDDTIGAYSDHLYTASFVGYLPADNPQLVIAVVVDEPTAGSIYGGDVAAPAFEQIAEFATNALRIEP
ncbi:MAG: peptidoglycan D,D-transpeptidase FtsI family protein, partial [Thermoleophilia bacterium]